MISTMRRFGVAAAMVIGSGAPAAAQLVAAKDGPIAYGHHHVNVSSVEAHTKFWVEGLGGTVVKIGTSTANVVKFPNVLVFLTARAPSGGTKGTSVNHVGFETPDIRAAVDRLKASGFPMVTRAEVPDTYTVKDDLGQRPGGNLIAFVMGPDDTKVELIENKALQHRIAMHHVHFATPDVAAMKAWYVKTFNARPGTRAGFEAADLPGVNLTFGSAAEPVVGTRGRALDHIGFEVKNLEAFTRQLEGNGIKLGRPYTKVPALNIAIAFFTDPWGTYIELTEGLDAVN
jgi:catechol 2,3-dioxygenase-like lactoylglutathione lyase family enzyme